MRNAAAGSSPQPRQQWAVPGLQAISNHWQQQFTPAAAASHGGSSWWHSASLQRPMAAAGGNSTASRLTGPWLPPPATATRTGGWFRGSGSMLAQLRFLLCTCACYAVAGAQITAAPAHLEHRGWQLLGLLCCEAG